MRTPAGWARLKRAVPQIGAAAGDIVEFAFWKHGYVIGHGLDQQKIGIQVAVGDELMTIYARDYDLVSAGEAKRWRAEAKKARSRERRSLDV